MTWKAKQVAKKTENKKHNAYTGTGTVDRHLVRVCVCAVFLRAECKAA